MGSFLILEQEQFSKELQLHAEKKDFCVFLEFLVLSWYFCEEFNDLFFLIILI